MAGIFPQGKNIQQYWQNILEGIDCITDIPTSRWKIEDYYDSNPQTADKTYCKRGGFIPDIEFNPLEFGMPPNVLEVTDVAQMLSLVVAKQALENAGYGNGNQSIRQKTGVVLGIGGGQKLITPLTSRLQYPIWEKVLNTSGLSEVDTQTIIEKIKLAYIPWEENSFPGMLGNVIARRVANRLDLGGINCVVDAACASSLSALRMAISELIEKRCDMMITGGVDTDNTIFMYMSFSKTPAFSKQGKICPFDVDADGMLIGEGLGMIVLKRLEDAQRDGDRIYAVIKGMGTSSDGKYKSIYAPRASGQALALHRAYEDAEIDPKTVSLIEAHGTGTIVGDSTEFASLNEIFSKNNPCQQYIALGSVKSQIGHTKSAAGVASLIKVALGLHHKILPPTINVSQPNPKLKIEESPFYLNTQTRPWLPINNEVPRRAGISSFGFGGTNFHVVLEEYQHEHDLPYRLHQTIDSILISAQTPQKLLTKCQTLREQLNSELGSESYQKLIGASQTSTIPRLSARVGFVSKNLTETLTLLATTIKYLANNLNQEYWEHPQGIFYRKTGINPQGKVVALFSGQGSQYLEMGKELGINFPQMRQAFQLMDRVLIEDNLTPISQIVFPIPTFQEAQKNEQYLTLNKTENTQPAIGTFNMGVYKILEQAGFKPDFVAGHSLGELTALWAAKVLNDEDYLILIKERGQAMSAPSDINLVPGKMLAVKGDLHQVKSIINEVENVIIANYNSMEQVVLAGASTAILAIKEQLEKFGLITFLLPVSAAFHTLLMSNAKINFAEAVKKVQFNNPQIPVYSNKTANVYPIYSCDNIKQILVDHIVHPVYFKDEIENIYNAGGKIFVELGAKSILTNLVKNILTDKPHVAVALNRSTKKDDSPKPINNHYFLEAIVQLRVAGLNLSNIDPYKLEQTSPVMETKKGSNVTLNGANYITEKTIKTFENALKDGYKIKPLNQKNDDIDNNYLNKETSFSNNDERRRLLNDNLSINIQDKKNNLSCENQSLTTNVNENELQFQSKSLSFMKSDQGINIMQQESNPNEKLKIESFERIMMRFYDHQAEVLNVHEQYLKTQLESSQHFFRLMQPQYSQLNANNENIEVSKPNPINLKISKSLTGEFLENQELIDSEKVTTQNNLAQEIKNYSSSINTTKSGDSSISQISSSELEGLTQSLLEVVSDKTGYPSEMLELEMDMEADLGIDSIKRVEILGAMQELYPNMPPVNPEELAELRTLKQIVDYIGHKLSSTEVNIHQTTIKDEDLVQKDSQEIENKNIFQSELEGLTQSLLEVVSDKTGYPSEMLELEMDMEADLGIDSIKRVEILGAMQELYPNMPPVNPEELAELRTLAQIIDHMGNKLKGCEKKTLTI